VAAAVHASAKASAAPAGAGNRNGRRHRHSAVVEVELLHPHPVVGPVATASVMASRGDNRIRRKGDRRQNRHDRNHDNELDQRETVASSGEWGAWYRHGNLRVIEGGSEAGPMAKRQSTQASRVFSMRTRPLFASTTFCAGKPRRHTVKVPIWSAPSRRRAWPSP